MLRAIIKFFINIYYSVFFKVEIKGKENLPKDRSLYYSTKTYK